MEQLKSFIRRLPTYLLLIVAIILFLLTYFGPQYIGVIPGLLGMATCIVLLGRAVRQNLDKRGSNIERPWWTQL
jgi:hypothetical protein